MMGKMTLSYGIAQVIGPAVTASLAMHLGGYRVGLYLAAGVMVVGAVLLGLLRVVNAQTHVSGSRAELSRSDNNS
jgi:MFS family permease